jgi:hypothetical protein
MVAAVAVGLWALAGMGSAGDPLPDVLPEAQPTAGGVVLVSGLAGGGCANGGCAAASAGPKTALHGLAIGAGCANPIGCGSPASEKTFVFGSCRQFYNPGNDCRGFFSCGGKHCGQPLVYGPGGLNDPICSYGSYMNR